MMMAMCWSTFHLRIREIHRKDAKSAKKDAARYDPRVRIQTFLVFLSVLPAAQVAGPRPNFSDYPVKEIYKGKPAPPKVVTRTQREFRTMIRQGAESKVEFAGHYTVPRWGCGAGCAMFAIVDSISGAVYDAPFAVSELPMEAWKKQDQPPERFEMRADSALLKISGCANEQDCGFYDFVMVEGKGLNLVRKEMLPKQFQP